MSNTRHILSLAALLASIALPLTSSAQSLERSFRDWGVYRHNGGCYIGSAPVNEAGNFSRRGQAYILVVNRSNGEEINVSSGYAYQGKQGAKATIDRKQFPLFTEGDTGWAANSNADATIVAAMKRGNRLVIRGTSERGTWSEDTYSLMGFSGAWKHMKTQCK